MSLLENIFKKKTKNTEEHILKELGIYLGEDHKQSKKFSIIFDNVMEKATKNHSMLSVFAYSFIGLAVVIGAGTHIFIKQYHENLSGSIHTISEVSETFNEKIDGVKKELEAFKEDIKEDDFNTLKEEKVFVSEFIQAIEKEFFLLKKQNIAIITSFIDYNSQTQILKLVGATSSYDDYALVLESIEKQKQHFTNLQFLEMKAQNVGDNQFVPFEIFFKVTAKSVSDDI